ncbi:MAG TPA: hypothetical protein DD723_08470 [Candidatus Omnitrophica bacterium]|nr:MAG: hypothetical protein A2Z81_00010 [Omnitrophica WOR_2 bacterium GWA2_45_18]HBR15553.1 hypothetical protein [Candidatus Omnitrophota bacterium]
MPIQKILKPDMKTSPQPILENYSSAEEATKVKKLQAILQTMKLDLGTEAAREYVQKYLLPLAKMNPKLKRQVFKAWRLCGER